MLLQKLIKSYWYIGVMLYVSVAAIRVESNEYFLFLATALVPFILFGVVISKVITWKQGKFTAVNLFFLSLICSLFIVFNYHQLSLYIAGDQFLFSKADAIEYFDIVNNLAKKSIFTWYIELKKTEIRYGYSVDDWGANIFIGIIYSICKSQSFLAIVYCFIGSATALNIFYIGRNIMCRKYSFIAALSFSLASFVVVMYGVFLKETIMIFIITSSFRFFYRYLNNSGVINLFFACLFAFLILLFRTPIALIILVSFAMTLILKYVNRLFIPIVILFSFLALTTTTIFLDVYENNFFGGDKEKISAMMEHRGTVGKGVVDYITEPLSAFFGPFPNVIMSGNVLNILHSSGLVFKLLLVLPFVMGMYYALKYKQEKLYPLFFFFLADALGLAFSLKALEVRLCLPHLFAFYLIAYWWLAHYDYRKFGFRMSNKVVNVFIVCVVVICLLWNLRNVI